MYTIGEFSKITNLSVKTLRYYEETGLLLPTARSEANYRLYSESDFARAELIILLRSLSFSIREIQDVLTNYESEADLQDYFREKQRGIKRKIKQEQELLRRIDQCLHPEMKEDKAMSYEMEIRKLPAVKTATIRFQGKFDEIGVHIGKLFKEVKGNADGAPFCLYYDAEFHENGHIDVGVPIKKVFAAKETTIQTLPAIDALCTTHVGSYESIHFAYKALLDYAKEQGLELQLPWREVYQKGPGMVLKGNPDKYVTEIQVPFTRK